ncbi:type I methionyl aminopeptidase [Fodinicola acaciae]|uniref:type I methionyl aminopeptidase n=1 Tax=Fodinicola acaciae TaxID=2681555 RepID=UPI0013D001B4|nr:type I methionyl aminopeptidase [Fodinicola acaciae]
MRPFRRSTIQLKTPGELDAMRAAGLVVQRALAAATAAVRAGVSTAELDAIAEESIRSEGAVPSFKGYHGFPASICASVNQQVVHGIPRSTQVLADGDLISIDCGAILDGWHGDSAVTLPVGAVKQDYLRMSSVCEKSMWAGIAAAVVGGRLTDISHAVETAVGESYGIVAGYGGHGIGTEMHMEPHILNFGKPGKGPRLVAGMALAIEPMITYGDPEVSELSDGWTVETDDGSVSAHWEHTIALTDSGPWVLTAADGGASALGAAVSEKAR